MVAIGVAFSTVLKVHVDFTEFSLGKKLEYDDWVILSGVNQTESL
jgi:hypothetical protein